MGNNNSLYNREFGESSLIYADGPINYPLFTYDNCIGDTNILLPRFYSIFTNKPIEGVYSIIESLLSSGLFYYDLLISFAI